MSDLAMLKCVPCKGGTRPTQGGGLKIKVIHDECGREVLVQQIRESEGQCPWDGKPFTGDPTATLAEVLGTAENAGSVLKRRSSRSQGCVPP